MKKFQLVVSALILLSAPCLFAEGTRLWKQSSFDDFEKGTAKGVAITSEGSLELAPALKAVYTTPSTYIWSVAADGQGNVFAATGSPARVYRITPDGQATVVLAPPELQVQALVADTSGVIYAATSPDGKVYKIERAPTAKDGKSAAPPTNEGKTDLDANFTSSVFFDPKTKYIWDLALDPQGQLYVATGDQGQIFRVDRKGESSVFFKSDEAHIRVLAFDTKGNLIAGSDGSGLVYRVSPGGEAFVLYSAPKKEITALAVDPAGNIFASGVGEKRAMPAAPMTFPQQTQPSPGAMSPHGPMGPQASSPMASGTGIGVVTVGTTPLPPFPTTPGSEVYQIAPDGSPRRIWSSRDDIVYALGFDDQGHLLAGSGNKARVYAIAGNGDYVDLLKASATQVTAFTKGPNNGLYVSTSNLGKIFLLGPQPDSVGSYESDVFDAHIFSRWGRLEVLGSGDYDIYARSGNVDNPDRNWSPWKKVDLGKDAVAEVPAARFIQWKAVLHPGPTPARIDAVHVNYRPNNVAPVIDEVIVQVGVRYQGMSMPKPNAEGSPVTTGGSGMRFEAPPPAVHDRESISARWTSHDDNDDELVYSIYYRGDNETQWKLLKQKVSEKYYTWDAGLFPDGGYTIKVVASDAPSHSPDEALADSKESTRFEVDNTPPRVENLNAAVESDEIHITFRAADNFSAIKRAEYSVDAGEWQFVEPVGLLSDNRVENYDFSVPLAGPKGASEATGKGRKRAKSELPAEHVVVVRVYDRFDNMGSAKTVVRQGKP
jgi:sugar lactone lactonase YvrE